ncbi:MAG: ABC transporter ATP-binding protein, partial [Acidobacteria bacterium]
EHDAVTRSTGYLSQRFSLYGDLTIDENIGFFAEIHGLRDYRSRADRLLEMTQLMPFRSRLADRLSGGMKQKLALACTLVHEPELILLDEPTTGVDHVYQREFWKLLSEFLSQGITIVMATPYLDEAERCSRVAMLSEGRVLVSDTPAALRASLPGVVFEVLASPQAVAMAVVRRLDSVAEVQNFGERIHVRLGTRDVAASSGAGNPEIERLARVLAGEGIDVRSIRPVQASLEDVFINLVAGSAGR